MNRTSGLGSVFLAVLAGVGAAGCTSLPEPAEMLRYGFRSPEQCLESFQLAVRADLPAEEYRCFSQHFRSENHVSQLVWREIREQLWGQVGMRWAVAEAKSGAPALVRGNRAQMQVRALGKEVRIELVLEDFAQLWSGPTLIQDQDLDFRSHTGAQESRWFYGQVELLPGVDPATVTEVRLGREWKIDAIDTDPGS